MYRVVQESLTNTLKHAGPATATVTVAYSDAEVRATIADDGRTQPEGPAHGPGHFGYGLIGMRERVALFGGSLETGAGPEGGFIVRARIPLAEAT